MRQSWETMTSVSAGHSGNRTRDLLTRSRALYRRATAPPPTSPTTDFQVEDPASPASSFPDDVTPGPPAGALMDLDDMPTSTTTDFQDEDPASPASSFPDAEPTSPAEASIHEVDHEADIQATGRSLTDGKFLGILELIDTLTVSKSGLPSIPMGQKKNTLFIIQNKKNMDRRAVGQGCFLRTIVVHGRTAPHQ